VRRPPGKHSHFTLPFAAKIPGGMVDDRATFWPYAIVQFNGEDSHVPDPGATLKYFFFGAFNVHLQKVN